MKIILLGYMGSGKTGVGRHLSQKLELPFRDLDQEICRQENRSISEIFSSSGEIYFRKKETDILRDLLKDSNEGYILSLGGGTPCYGKNLQILTEAPGAVLVYLKTSLQELTQRLKKEQHSRPLIAHLETEELLKDFIRKHLFERTYYYNQSEIIVETDSKNFEEISEEILKKLE